MSNKRNRKVIKKRKLKVKAFFAFLILVLIFSFAIWYINNIKITNIYISGNKILSDVEIMRIAKIDNYPKSLKNNTNTIEKRLEKNNYIKDAIVKKKGFFNEIYIEVIENKPLYYDAVKNKTILMDGSEVDDKYNIPTLINEVPKDKIEEFLECMGNIDDSIIIKISEVRYYPNDIDKERFYLTMNDGNYVYLTLNKFANINNYISIIKTVDNKKGILYLDSGEYFDVFE